MTDTGVALQSSGRIEYTDRAAMYDAAAAMRGDVVRALVELITNCDDAYDEAGRGGPIRIVAEHNRTGEFNRITVGDQATGMTLDMMKVKLCKAGGRESGHEQGKRRRGLLGRGAKDVAYFGKATFESIRDGRIASVTLFPTGQYQGPRDRPASTADYDRLRIPHNGSGTQVTMFVRVGSFRIPRHDTLATRLRQHVQLRIIMQDDTREVTLARPGELFAERLQYVFPIARTQVGATTALTVNGYPQAEARLTLWRCESPLPDIRDSSRDAGILVTGRRAVYECTYFGAENRQGARHYVGLLDCPTIDDLQQAYDDTVFERGEVAPEANRGPIVLRTREGLDDSHLFVRALAAAVDGKFLPLVDEAERAEAEKGGRESPETAKRLREAARELAEAYDAIAKELEAEVETGEGVDSPRPEPIALEVIPGGDVITIAPGASVAFTVRAWPEAWVDNESAPDPLVSSASVEDRGIATVEPAQRELLEDPRCNGRFRGTFTLRAGAREDATTLNFRLGRLTHEMIVDVVSPEPPPVIAPERLMWDHRTYTAKVGRPKVLVLMAPRALVEEAAKEPALLSANSEIIALPESLTWDLVEAVDGQRWYEAPVTVTGDVHGVVQVRARCAGKVAACQLTITEHGGRGLFNFKIVDRDHKYESQGRADWISPGGVRTLEIYGRHAALALYFGKRLVNQDTLQCRMLVAELLATALAHDLLQAQERSNREASPHDAGAYVRKFNPIMDRLLVVAQKVMTPEMMGKWGAR